MHQCGVIVAHFQLHAALSAHPGITHRIKQRHLIHIHLIVFLCLCASLLFVRSASPPCTCTVISAFVSSSASSFARSITHVRNTGQLCHLDSVALVCTALNDLAQEYDIVAVFFYRNTIIIHSRQACPPAPSAHGNVWQTAFLLRAASALLICSTTAQAMLRSVKGARAAVRSHRGSAGCCAVALRRIFATSVISTMNVLCPLARSSEAPTLVKIRSTSPIFAAVRREQSCRSVP